MENRPFHRAYLVKNYPFLLSTRSSRRRSAKFTPKLVRVLLRKRQYPRGISFCVDCTECRLAIFNLELQTGIREQFLKSLAVYSMFSEIRNKRVLVFAESFVS